MSTSPPPPSPPPPTFAASLLPTCLASFLLFLAKERIDRLRYMCMREHGRIKPWSSGRPQQAVPLTGPPAATAAPPPSSLHRLPATEAAALAAARHAGTEGRGGGQGDEGGGGGCEGMGHKKCLTHLIIKTLRNIFQLHYPSTHPPIHPHMHPESCCQAAAGTELQQPEACPPPWLHATHTGWITHKHGPAG